MTKIQFLRLWTIGVGAMDAFTGLLLMVAPGFVFQLLQIELPVPDSMVFVNWIGVFVMGVGLSYGFALGKNPSAAIAIWWSTALIRTMVAVFLIIQIIAGKMDAVWLSVAVSDGLVATVQAVILRLGWWEEAGR